MEDNLEEKSYYNNDKVFLAMRFKERIDYSVAISLKRIADALSQCDQYGMTGSYSISLAIRDGLREGISLSK